MRLKHVQYLIFFVIFAISCSSDEKKNDDVPFIDVSKTYPEKELIITDFADVSYVHLNTDDEDYLYKGSVLCVTKNTYVVNDKSSGSVLFFSRDGIPKSRFNRLGQGPEEYISFDRIIYDEETDDVFVIDAYGSNNNQYVQVYSSTGEYKRKITMPQNARLQSLVSFDDKSLFVFAEEFHAAAYSRIKWGKDVSCITTYYRISKLNGEILDSFELISNEVVLAIQRGSTVIRKLYSRLAKGVDGLFLCNPETDTVFYYTGDKPLIPVFHKIPLVRNQDPKVVIPNILDGGRYMFFSIEALVIKSQDICYFMDKETGEIFKQKLILHDFKGKEFEIFVSVYMLDTGDRIGYIYELELSELKEAYKENRLSGKLKELVATLNEDKDNNVFMLVNFKK
jgi:hypothetical protein